MSFWNCNCRLVEWLQHCVNQHIKVGFVFEEPRSVRKEKLVGDVAFPQKQAADVKIPGCLLKLFERAEER